MNDLYGRLLQFILVGESSIRTLSKQPRLDTQTGKNFLRGAQVSWQNVVAEVTNFTTAEAKVVPTLGTMVGLVRAAATEWLNALFKAQQAVQSGTAKTFSDIAPLFRKARVAEAQVRSELRRTAAAIASAICDLETRNPGLAPGGSPAGDCAAAAKLPSP